MDALRAKHKKTICAAMNGLLFALLAAGCAPVGTATMYTAIESDQELVFSHKYRSLVLIRASGRDACDLAESETTIISPRFSPDGNRIAFYDLGTSSGLPNSSRTVSLVIVDLAGEGGPDDGLVFPIDQFDTDHRLMVDDVIPPLWTPDGQAVWVAHNAGIERITVSRERQAIVPEGKIRAIAASHAGDFLIYSDGRNVFLHATRTGTSQAMLNAGFVPQFGNKFISALALSPGEDRLVFAMGHELFVIDMETHDVRSIYEASNRVYWLAWVPGREEILFLSGREFGGRAGFSRWMNDAEGRYRLYSIASTGEGAIKLFSENRLDVRQAAPHLSPDGRFVSLTARGGAVKEIVLVAIDGSGVNLLTHDGPNSYASWR
jgi:Tol biopolymer transport system component